MTVDPPPLTMSVPEAGKRYLSLSRNASCAAASRGEIPTIRIGRLLRVPIKGIDLLVERASEKSRDSRAA